MCNVTIYHCNELHGILDTDIDIDIDILHYNCVTISNECNNFLLFFRECVTVYFFFSILYLFIPLFKLFKLYSFSFSLFSFSSLNNH